MSDECQARYRQAPFGDGRQSLLRDRISQQIAGKLIAKYDIVGSKFVRARRKAAGKANLQLILHGRFFLILATQGEHPFYQEEKARLRDCREAPIRYASYAIGFRDGHVQVRIDRDTERDLKAFFRQSALWTRERLEKEFWSLPFEPYAPVRRQILVIFNQVNKLRREAGFDPLRTSCLRFRRKPCPPSESLRKINHRDSKGSETQAMSSSDAVNGVPLIESDPSAINWRISPMVTH